MQQGSAPFVRGGAGRGEIQPKHKINGDIRYDEVRVVDSDGKMLGIMPTREAIKRAEGMELDLVEIAPQANPPVCKIVDYSKFLYDQAKKDKAQKKTQSQQQMKEIRFKWRTALHDFNFKVRHARQFIKEGNKVKASVMFRGREITHQEIGKELLLKFVEAMQDVAKVDSQLKFEGKHLSVVMAPDKDKKPKTATPSADA
ncbi:MAG: translation initiation factor IF-3 [Chloroflexota bacterium]